MTRQKEDDMHHSTFKFLDVTSAERDAGIRSVLTCKADGKPNWIAEISPAVWAVGFTRREAVKAAVAKYREAVAAEATDEPEPDYGGAMDSTGMIHSDAEGGL
jgi:tripartite-type tricarboxylate transporter receptor subunit TctC